MRDASLVVIEPGVRSAGHVGQAVWSYRELLYFLVWRDLKVRYKQTALGAAWALIQPLTTMVVFSLFFGRLAGVPSDGVPYPVFSLAALVPWTYFATALTGGAQSLVASQNLVAKVYFPRLIVPMAAVITPLVDAAIAMGLLAMLMAWYGIVPGSAVAWLPLFVVLAVLSAAAMALWLAALNVKYRDVRYVVPFLVQVWLFVTPVAYPTSIVPERWRVVYSLNPMATVVEGFRWSLVGAPAPGAGMVLASTVAALVLLWAGARYFTGTERSFADVI